FFSSRRRHTRFKCDWSSDVCSSDLLDLRGARLLDAGCGTGSFSIEAARRGAEVVAVDISPTLIEIAQRRLPDDISRNAIHFVARSEERRVGKEGRARREGKQSGSKR